jgi:S1-C subfamily serine protease
MSAGIFSQVTSESIRFDGFTVEGSSGSPVFNANGEVVAVHRGGLRGATGLGFAVPITQLIPLLPPEVKAELGIE